MWLVIKTGLSARSFLSLCFASLLALTATTQAQEADQTEQALIMPLAEHSLLLDVAPASEATFFAVGVRGHILKSTDSGQSWQQQNVPSKSTLTGVYFLNEKLGWAVGHDSVILKTEDAGDSWRRVYFDPEDQRPLMHVRFIDAQQGLAVGAYGLFMRSQDGGETWEVEDFSPELLASASSDEERDDEEAVDQDVEVSVQGMAMTFLEDGFFDLHLNHISVSPQGRVFIAAESGTVFRSDDQGQSWFLIATPYNGSFFSSLALSDDEVFVLGMRGNMFTSINGGVSWDLVTNVVETTLNDIAVGPEGRFVVAAQDGVLLVSTNNGKKFSALNVPDRHDYASVVFTSSDHIILVGEAGVERINLESIE